VHLVLLVPLRLVIGGREKDYVGGVRAHCDKQERTLPTVPTIRCFRDPGRKMDMSEGDALLIYDVPGLKVRDWLLRHASMQNSAVNMDADGRRTVYIYIHMSYIHIYIRAECARAVLIASDALATDVDYFFESMSTSTVDIDRQSVFLV